MNIPNSLSIFRIVLIPVFIISYFGFPNELTYISGIILLISGLTDIIDGYIARKFNQITYLGKILDPLADKLTIFSVLTCLSIKHNSIFILALLYFTKELAMAIGGIKIVKAGNKIASAKWYGKITTFYIYSIIILMLFNLKLLIDFPTIIIGIAIFFVVFSLIMYIFEYFKIMKNTNI